MGIGFGPLLLGLSFDRLGTYRPGLLLFIGLALLAAVLTFLMPAYREGLHQAEDIPLGAL